MPMAASGLEPMLIESSRYRCCRISKLRSFGLSFICLVPFTKVGSFKKDWAATRREGSLSPDGFTP